MGGKRDWVLHTSPILMAPGAFLLCLYRRALSKFAPCLNPHISGAPKPLSNHYAARWGPRGQLPAVVGWWDHAPSPPALRVLIPAVQTHHRCPGEAMAGDEGQLSGTSEGGQPGGHGHAPGEASHPLGAGGLRPVAEALHCGPNAGRNLRNVFQQGRPRKAGRPGPESQEPAVRRKRGRPTKKVRGLEG
jgi:hypothetical protein